MEPRRASRLRHPTVRLVSEYIGGFVGGIRRAPLSSADRRECYGHLTRWLASRAVRRSTGRIEDSKPDAAPTAIPDSSAVAGQRRVAEG